MEKKSISVKINNETYVLRTDAAEEDVVAIAKMVDERMQSLLVGKNLDTRKLAVWTALDLAADLQALQKRYEALVAIMRER